MFVSFISDGPGNLMNKLGGSTVAPGKINLMCVCVCSCGWNVKLSSL